MTHLIEGVPTIHFQTFIIAGTKMFNLILNLYLSVVACLSVCPVHNHQRDFTTVIASLPVN